METPIPWSDPNADILGDIARHTAAKATTSTAGLTSYIARIEEPNEARGYDGRPAPKPTQKSYPTSKGAFEKRGRKR